MTDTTMNSKGPAVTAGAQTKPAVAPTAQASAAVQKPLPDAQPAQLAQPAQTAPKLTFNRGKFQGIKLARLRLLKPGIMQYDPAYPELVLNTDSKEGMILPLTPFFSGRLNKTVELISIIEE